MFYVTINTGRIVVHLRRVVEDTSAYEWVTPVTHRLVFR